MRDKKIKYDCPWCGPNKETTTITAGLTLFQDGVTNPRLHIPCKCGHTLSIELHNEEHIDLLTHAIRKDHQIIDVRDILDWGFEFLDGLEDREQLAGLVLDETRT